MKNTSGFEQRIQCLAGTFAIENMQIPSHLISTFQQLDTGNISYQQLVENTRKRYMKESGNNVL